MKNVNVNKLKMKKAWGDEGHGPNQTITYPMFFVSYMIISRKTSEYQNLNFELVN